MNTIKNTNFVNQKTDQRRYYDGRKKEDKVKKRETENNK